jgi:hypothetical protein
MKIETRLEKLEHEFKILKNEIQATLLEIREQLLTQQYPALRAEEGTTDDVPQGYPAPASTLAGAPLRSEATERPARVKGAGVPLAPSMQRPEAPFAAYANGNSGSVSHRRSTAPAARGGIPLHHTETPAFTDLSYEDQFGSEIEEPFGATLDPDRLDSGSYGTDFDDDAYEDTSLSGARFSPHTREVSLSEIKRAHAEPGIASPQQNGGRNAPPRVNFAALAEWVGLAVQTLGKERTRQAVETYAASGYVMPDTQKTILQLLSLSPDDEPAEQPGSTATIELLVKLDGILNAQ